MMSAAAQEAHGEASQVWRRWQRCGADEDLSSGGALTAAQLLAPVSLHDARVWNGLPCLLLGTFHLPAP